jgi:hypothetical protein
MSFDMRAQIEKDLGVTLEGDYGLPVELTGPDGEEITTSANSVDPQNPEPLYGQVLYTTTRMNPDTGEEMVVNEPVVVLRRSSLSRIPEPGENWFVRFPKDPDRTAELSDFAFTPDRAPEGGRSIGFIRLYPHKAEQS